MASWLLSAAVARLMHCAVDDVNRCRKRGELFAGRRRSGRYAFPPWQFDQQNRPLRGLQLVLAALDDKHPTSVTPMMTTPLHELDDLTPAQWLARKKPIPAVLEVFDEWKGI